MLMTMNERKANVANKTSDEAEQFAGRIDTKPADTKQHVLRIANETVESPALNKRVGKYPPPARKKEDIHPLPLQRKQNITEAKPEIVAGLTDENVYKLIIEIVRTRGYKIKIIPFDLWDFGGQKDYYMTHQLFITSRGVYVVMFNGSIDIHKYLPELGYLPGQYGEPTTADSAYRFFTSTAACYTLQDMDNQTEERPTHYYKTDNAKLYLMHWVNSILTYCKKTKTGFPKIIFVATHKDLLDKNDVEQTRTQHIRDITALFESHVGRQHLQYHSLIFVNARDPEDPEVELLKKELMKCAVENPRWGEPMPTAWVPLELELIEQVEKGVNILTREQLEGLNAQNPTMVLNPKQLETFLKIQHSLGKIIYFDDVHLKNFVIINPVFMIEVLRTIVTHTQFWPKDEALQQVLGSLRKTGLLSKQDLFSIWEQPHLKHVYDFKEYMLDMLKNLDILIEQRKDWEPVDSQDETFIVPCMISRPNETDFSSRWIQDKYSIHLAYRFCDAVIPPAIVYRFLGSFISMWSFKQYGRCTMLFIDLAVVEVDTLHDLAVRVVGNAVVVSLINSTGKDDILPTIATSVQECLTTNLQRITEFYSSVSDDQMTSNFPDKQNPFKIEFGVFCTQQQNDMCFFHHTCVSSAINATWTCKTHNVKHQVDELKIWFADKVGSEICIDTCKGIGPLISARQPSDRHLRRLADVLTMEECKQLVLNLDLPFTIWDKLLHQFPDPNYINFMALRRCKERHVYFTFANLHNSLEKISTPMIHRLCQVTTEHELKCKLPEERLREIPTDEILEKVSNHIGAASLALGVELGLEVPILEGIQADHRLKLLEQTRQILKVWKKLQKPKPTILILVKALERIGKAGCIQTCIG